MTLSPRFRRLAAIGMLAILVLAWAGAAAAWYLLDPGLAQWTLIVTAVALVTEVTLWVGAALLGIAAFARVRGWLRLRRGIPRAGG
ncbi:MAG: hypothetical protein ACAH11_13455 [Sphingomonas sp.]